MASDTHAPQRWLRLRFICDADVADALVDHLCECGALAVSLDDAADEPLFEPAAGSTPLWARTRVSGLFPAQSNVHALLSRLEEQFPPGTLRAPEVDRLEDRDWTRSYRDAFEPTCFGGRLWVVPSWVEPLPLAAGHVSLTLDPGLAFGTGNHPTTAMCLDWLAAERIDDRVVVDYGCGSGILAVAAAKLGARRVWAVDHDPQALEATRRNAAANAVDGRVDARAPGELPPLTADLLVSNILANTLCALAESLAGLLEPGARLALAGILGEQSPRVVKRFAHWCALRVVAQRDDWVLLDGTRRDHGV